MEQTQEILKELRASLSAVSNAGGVAPGLNAVEINAKINAGIVDAAPKFNEVRAMIPREAHDQGAFIWDVRTSSNGSTRWGYTFSENVATSNTNSGTPLQGAKVQLYSPMKSFRTDWEVEGLFKAASSSFYDAVADEIKDALAIHLDDEEKQIVGGADAGAYGDAAGFYGLKQIVQSYLSSSTDTTNVYGIARASGKTYLNAQVVDAATLALSLAHLDKAITAMKKVKGVPGFFLVSYDRSDEINSLLQAQQRFVGTVNTPAGFTVTSYQGVPIIRSMYADKLGAADTDTAVLLIAAGNLVMKTLADTQSVDADLGRYDAVGGYIKTYETLVCKDLTKNVLIERLATPQ